MLSEKDMNELGKKFVNVSQLLSWRSDAVKNLESELKSKGVKFQKPGSDKGKESAQSPNGKKRFREEEEDARGEPLEVRKSARGQSKTPARDDAQQHDEDDDVPLGDRVRKHTDTTRRKKQAAESRRSKKRNQEEEEDQEEQSPSKTKKKGSGERRETTSKDNDKELVSFV